MPQNARPAAATSRPPSPVEWGLLAILAVAWGSAFLFATLALRELPPFTVSMGRIVIGSLTLICVLVLTGKRLTITRQTIWLYASLGAVNTAIPLSLVTLGQTMIVSSLAAVSIGMMPVFGAIFAHLLTRDQKISLQRAIGIAIAFTGLFVIFGPSVLASGEINPLGVITVLGAAATMGFSAIHARKLFALGLGPVESAVGQSLFAVLWVTLAMLIFEEPWHLPIPSATTIAAVAALGLISTGFGYILYYYLVIRMGPSNVTLVGMMNILTAILLGAIFLGERLAWYQLAGIAVMIGGLSMISYRRRHPMTGG